MSSYSPSFLEDCLKGRTKLSDIDGYVRRWHEAADNGTDLASYLGMSDDEYERWLRNPDALESIVAAHRRNVHAAE